MSGETQGACTAGHWTRPASATDREGWHWCHACQRYVPTSRANQDVPGSEGDA